MRAEELTFVVSRRVGMRCEPFWPPHPVYEYIRITHKSQTKKNNPTSSHPHFVRFFPPKMQNKETANKRLANETDKILLQPSCVCGREVWCKLYASHTGGLNARMEVLLHIAHPRLA